MSEPLRIRSEYCKCDVHTDEELNVLTLSLAETIASITRDMAANMSFCNRSAILALVYATMVVAVNTMTSEEECDEALDEAVRIYREARSRHKLLSTSIN